MLVRTLWWSGLHQTARVCIAAKVLTVRALVRRAVVCVNQEHSKLVQGNGTAHCVHQEDLQNLQGQIQVISVFCVQKEVINPIRLLLIVFSAKLGHTKKICKLQHACCASRVSIQL